MGEVGRSKGKVEEGKEDPVEEADASSGGLPEIPEEWKRIPIQDYFDKGFRPYKHNVDGKLYITLKKGRFEKSLGPYSEDRWQLLLSMYPKKIIEARRSEERKKVEDYEYLKSVPEPRSSSRRRSALLKVSLAPPPSLPRTIEINPKTLSYYEWALSKGYKGSLGDFLNEVCYAYFAEKGIEPVIYIVEKEESEEEA